MLHSPNKRVDHLVEIAIMTKQREWRSLRAYPDYSVSNDGKVRDKHRNAATITVGNDGRAYVRLRIYDGPVAVLVAHEFHDKPHGKVVVAHRDGDLGNDHADNLAYVDGTDYGRMMQQSGRHHRKPKPPPPWPLPDGRIKEARSCRRGHELSLTGKPDSNTAIHGFGNRICRRCWAEELTDVIRYAPQGAGRW